MAVNLEAERARLAQVAAPQIKKKEKARYMDGLRAQILGEPQTQPPLSLSLCVHHIHTRARTHSHTQQRAPSKWQRRIA